MAIVLYGSIIEQIKGRVGGAVFQKLGASLGVRAYSTFKPSSSQLAQTKRHQMNQVAAGWRALTPAKKLLYQTYAPNYPVFNRYGAPIVLNGYQLFSKINKRLLSFGIGMSTNPGAYSVWGNEAYTMGNYSQGSVHFDLVLSAGQPQYDAILLYLSPIVPKGTILNNIKHKAWLQRQGGVIGTANLFALLPDEYKTFDTTKYGFQVITMQTNIYDGRYNALWGVFTNIQ